LLDVSELQKTNSFSTQENRTHFILLNTWESYPENTKAAGYRLPKTFLLDLQPIWVKKPCLTF
jgi:hypothetical protein